MPYNTLTIAIDPALSFGLDFDSRDLRANRGGRISSRQVRLLRDKRRQKPAQPSLFGRIRGSMFYLIYGVPPHKHQWNLVGADITATIAKHQHGRVKLPKLPSPKDKKRHQSTYQIAVDRKRCKVNRRALGCFRHQDEYTVYYAPRSKHALSAESD